MLHFIRPKYSEMSFRTGTVKSAVTAGSGGILSKIWLSKRDNASPIASSELNLEAHAPGMYYLFFFLDVSR